MKKKLIGVVIVIAVLAIAAAAVSVTLLVRGGFPGKLLEVNNSTVVNVTNLQQQILSIGELATLEYDYTNVIEMKDSLKIKNFKVPGTQKSFIVSFDGTMKIGIETSGIVIDAPEDAQTIFITVPKAKILSHEIHEETLKVLDQKSGLFNVVKIEDYATLATAQKQAMADKVSASDMITRAQNDAVKMLQSLIAGIVPEGYTVEVGVAAP